MPRRALFLLVILPFAAWACGGDPSPDPASPPGSGGAGGATGNASTTATASSASDANASSTSDTTDSGGAGSGSGSGGATTGSATSGAGSSAEGGAGVDEASPGAPVLLSVISPIHGTHSLEWENPASGCTTVEINRSVDGGAYEVALTLTGEAISASHSPSHDPGTFCYTITCVLDGVASSPSNEMCLTQ